MIPRLTEDGVTLITLEECEQDWRELREAAERLNATEDCAAKVAACMNVFGRRANDVLLATRELYK